MQHSILICYSLHPNDYVDCEAACKLERSVHCHIMHNALKSEPQAIGREGFQFGYPESSTPSFEVSITFAEAP